MNKNNNKPKCLIGCSGSVATLKLPQIISTLSEFYEIRVICTTNAKFFYERSKTYNLDAFVKIDCRTRIYTDADEWMVWNAIGDPILHIELRRWADVFLIAPASADFISKASIGICDNLLLSVLKAWDFNKPCIVCPAMNTFMYENPTTTTAVETLKKMKISILGPIEKKLACNDVGFGAMSSVEEIKLFMSNLSKSLKLEENSKNIEMELAMKNIDMEIDYQNYQTFYNKSKVHDIEKSKKNSSVFSSSSLSFLCGFVGGIFFSFIVLGFVESFSAQDSYNVTTVSNV
jgi:phosphopantothenoylcysteine decarboxylase